MKKTTKLNITIRRAVTLVVSVLLILTVTILPVFAEGDGVTDSLTKFNNLLFAIVRLIGVSICTFGGVEFAMSMQSHDGGQKSRGITIFAAGLVVFFIKEILTVLGVSL